VSWVSVERWAADWFAEWRAEDHGDASEFIQNACKDAVPGVVGALIVLAEAAGGDVMALIEIPQSCSARFLTLGAGSG
jgi:hypothetical protein